MISSRSSSEFSRDKREGLDTHGIITNMNIMNLFNILNVAIIVVGLPIIVVTSVSIIRKFQAIDKKINEMNVLLRWH